MPERPTTIERAFDLARSGTCRDLGEIMHRLKAEGLDNVEAHLAGAGIRSELRQICQRSRLTSGSADQRSRDEPAS